MRTLKSHTIAEAHIKKLLNYLTLIMEMDPSLLEFGRRLDTADRILAGTDIEHVADLNEMNMLRDLAKKLPMFLRAKWTECAMGG